MYIYRYTCIYQILSTINPLHTYKHVYVLLHELIITVVPFSMRSFKFLRSDIKIGRMRIRNSLGRDSNIERGQHFEFWIRGYDDGDLLGVMCNTLSVCLLRLLKTCNTSVQKK